MVTRKKKEPSARDARLDLVIDDEKTAPGPLAYLVDLVTSRAHRCLSVEVRRRNTKAAGPPGKWPRLSVDRRLILSLDDPADGELLDLLLGTVESANNAVHGLSFPSRATSFDLARSARERVAPLLGRTGRCYLRRDYDTLDAKPLTWDDGGALQLVFQVKIIGDSPANEIWEVTGGLRRGTMTRPLTDADLVLEGGLVILDGRLAQIDDDRAWSWIDLLRRHTRIRIPAGHQAAFLEEIYALPRPPDLELPYGRTIAQESIAPTPHLHLRAPEPGRPPSSKHLFAELRFDYGTLEVPLRKAGNRLYDADRRRVLVRDPEAELRAQERLDALGFDSVSAYLARIPGEGPDLQIAAARLPAATRALVAEGWRVTAMGKLYRRPGKLEMRLASGIDWFDLKASCDFDGVSADLPSLLDALKRGQTEVVLGDGSLGMLPEEWLSRYGLLASLATVHDGKLRFKRSQAFMLDALLAAAPEVDVDATFAKAREELSRFETITQMEPPASFQGELRGYQKEGLGWLHFLERFGFGGCLADDMGLGKTVQVLALLASRRESRTEPPPSKSRSKKVVVRRPGPSIVVAPRSLIFNWKSEAARFAPELRVLEHTGNDRLPPGEHFHDVDVVLTTYGVLRRDIAELSAITFDYAVLDEAQAIKNDATSAAKAARLLKADHRLALSGTPIENHLGELWSLFEFLNPGMLGRAAAFKDFAALHRGGSEDAEAIPLLAKAIRPFLLRRTKAQVAPELPERTEETRSCELGPKQRALYDELRAHYQAALLQRVAQHGLAQSKIQVLEALLRLRQAACHPGLLDATRRDEESAKLDVLFEDLPDLVEKGHKTLVFSQFTSLLSIVREGLDKRGIVYAYLDGHTVDRQACVDRFQNDPTCQVFLISLKAGGLGLNLTAAEYVFLLDPWWNPAVEAQAIDRAHRIGQTRPVFAYRLIAANTIEERILTLQHQKRSLAESVIDGGGSLLQDLTSDDLALLLS
jgi:superfamily II DNA or RNA helicase